MVFPCIACTMDVLVHIVAPGGLTSQSCTHVARMPQCSQTDFIVDMWSGRIEIYKCRNEPHESWYCHVSDSCHLCIWFMSQRERERERKRERERESEGDKKSESERERESGTLPLLFYSLLSSPSSKIEQKVGKYAIMQLKAVSLQNTLILQPARLRELTCCLNMRELCPALYFFALYRVLAFLVVKWVCFGWAIQVPGCKVSVLVVKWVCWL